MFAGPGVQRSPIMDSRLRCVAHDPAYAFQVPSAATRISQAASQAVNPEWMDGWMDG